jgi:hypothetical protein
MYSIEIQDVPADGTIMVELRLSPGGHIQVLCEAVLGDVDVQAVLAALQLA